MTAMTEKDPMGKNQPVKKFRAGGVTATVWANEGKDQNGKPNTYHTVNIERSYKDAKGEWATTSSMRLHDLAKVELVTRKAYEFLAMSEDAVAND